MKKLTIATVLFAFMFLYFVRPAAASLVTIDPAGHVTWQILGYEIGVKKVVDEAASNNSTIALNNVNGRIVLNGVDVTNLNENLIEIQARGDSNEIKIGQEGGQFTLTENNIKATTNFPITVDPAKNQLLVTTSSGMRLLTILPDEAVQSLIRARIIDKVENNRISISENSDGVLMYQIDGVKNINLFNIAKIDTKISSSVSASNGEIQKIDEPQWLKFLGFLFT